jgi:hypothetical protein
MKRLASIPAVSSFLCLALLGCDEILPVEPDGGPDVEPADSGTTGPDGADGGPADVDASGPAACALEESGAAEFAFDGFVTPFIPGNYPQPDNLASDSERVRLTLTRDPAGAWSGTLRFGDAELAGEFTDTDVCPPHLANSSPYGFTDGVQYSLEDLQVDCERLRFTVPQTDPWRSWCELQTPIADETNEGHYNCVPNTATLSGDDWCILLFDDGTEQEVDCCKLDACRSVCDCTETGCRVADYPGPGFDFDVDGDEMQAFFPYSDGVQPTEIRLRAAR